MTLSVKWLFINLSASYFPLLFFFEGIFNIFQILCFVDCMCCKYLLPICGLSFLFHSCLSMNRKVLIFSAVMFSIFFYTIRGTYILFNKSSQPSPIIIFLHFDLEIFKIFVFHGPVRELYFCRKWGRNHFCFLQISLSQPISEEFILFQWSANKFLNIWGFTSALCIVVHSNWIVYHHIVLIT